MNEQVVKQPKGFNRTALVYRDVHVVDNWDSHVRLHNDFAKVDLREMRLHDFPIHNQAYLCQSGMSNGDRLLFYGTCVNFLSGWRRTGAQAERKSKEGVMNHAPTRKQNGLLAETSRPFI